MTWWLHYYPQLLSHSNAMQILACALPLQACFFAAVNCTTAPSAVPLYRVQVCVSDLRPTFPEDCCMPEEYQELARDCWQRAPECRPCFSSIVQRLDAMLQRARGRCAGLV